MIADNNGPTNVNDKMDVSNVNDSIGNLHNDNDSTITWDNVVAMEEHLLLDSGTESCKRTFQDVRSN